MIVPVPACKKTLDSVNDEETHHPRQESLNRNIHRENSGFLKVTSLNPTLF